VALVTAQWSNPTPAGVSFQSGLAQRRFSPNACRLVPPGTSPVSSRDHGLNSRLKRRERLIVSLPHAAATTASDDGRRSGIKLTPSNAAPAIRREYRLDEHAHHDHRLCAFSAQSFIAD